ncbi:MAG: helix-turn-helix transcriptional regulator [Bacteroidales bacterium]|nr:helix-turn-helix transcriptional regulator [Bacteroidales bacterium]MBR0245138.1 helix-turn-helix transcriptional regulator [Bacteroidales bacterium]
MANEVKNAAVESAAQTAQTPNSRARMPFSPGTKKGARLRPVFDFLMDENVSLSELGRRVGISRQSMSTRFAVDDCKMSDMEKMADALGYDFEWTFKKRQQ